MADVLVKSAFQSGATDTGDASKLGPTAYNAARLFSAGNEGEIIVRRAASATGAAWEVPATVAAAAGTLTGATLAANVLASSLTSLGTIAALKVGDGLVATPSMAFGSETGLGWYRSGTNGITLATGGANYFTSDGAKFKMAAGLPFGWTASNSVAALDTGLSRTAPGVVALGTGAQGNAGGTFNAALYQTAGVSGVATFGPAAVASITIKGGIVTAIS
jgi:hypothetical protein